MSAQQNTKTTVAGNKLPVRATATIFDSGMLERRGNNEGVKPILAGKSYLTSERAGLRIEGSKESTTKHQSEYSDGTRSNMGMQNHKSYIYGGSNLSSGFRNSNASQTVAPQQAGSPGLIYSSHHQVILKGTQIGGVQHQASFSEGVIPNLTTFSGKSSITLAPQSNASPPLLQRQGGHTTAGELTLQLRNMMQQPHSDGIGGGVAKEGLHSKSMRRESSSLPSSQTEVLLQDAASKMNKNSDVEQALKLPIIKKSGEGSIIKSPEKMLEGGVNDENEAFLRSLKKQDIAIPQDNQGKKTAQQNKDTIFMPSRFDKDRAYLDMVQATVSPRALAKKQISYHYQNIKQHFQTPDHDREKRDLFSPLIALGIKSGVNETDQSKACLQEDTPGAEDLISLNQSNFKLPQTQQFKLDETIGGSQINHVGSYMSPKLVYKKRKREFYQSNAKHQPTFGQGSQSQPMNHLNLVPIAATGKGDPKLQNVNSNNSPKNKISSQQVNCMINQLLLKNGNQPINFVTGIKNPNQSAYDDSKAALPQQQQQSSKQPLSRIAGDIADSNKRSKLRSMPSRDPNNDKVETQGKISGLAHSTQSTVDSKPIGSQQEGESQPLNQQAVLTFKSLAPSSHGNKRVLNASELFELAKQIKYKQLNSIQARQQSSSTPLGQLQFGIQNSTQKGKPDDNLEVALNVVKLNDKKQLFTPTPIGIEGADSRVPPKHSPEIQRHRDFINMYLNQHFNLDNTYSNQGPVRSVFPGQDPDSSQYLKQASGLQENSNEEFTILTSLISSREGAISQDKRMQAQVTTHQSKRRLSPISKTVIDPVDSFSTPGGPKNKLLQNSFDRKTRQHSTHFHSNGTMFTHVNPSIHQQQQILISQVHQLLLQHQAHHHSSSSAAHQDPQQHHQQLLSLLEPQIMKLLEAEPLLLAYGKPFMRQINEEQEEEGKGSPQPGARERQQHSLGSEAVIYRQTNEALQKELRARIQKKKLKQQQIFKVTKVYELEKLLYTLPGFEDGPTINLNPGGGGRVTNRPTLNVSQKKRIEPQLTDNENEEFQEHGINKTIKMMAILNALMFKVNQRDGGQTYAELFSRCVRYFNLIVPKPYKNDMVGLMKQKEFLAHAKERMITTFNSQINKANGVTEQMLTLNQSQGQYKYSINGGNNHMLVKQVFKGRAWWIQSEKETFDECNFIWTQWLKERLIKSLPAYSELGPQGIVGAPRANGQDAQEEQEDQTQPMFKIYNKIQGNQCLSDKKHLFFNMRELYQSQGVDPFLVMPLTYVINDGLNDVEFDRFEERFKAIEEENRLLKESGLPCSQNVWIVKPGEDTNRGSGIIVSKDFQEIKQLVRDKSSRTNRTAILQKYIENPLLINKRKFDIRCYGLLTSINGRMLGFFYTDGYLRTSSKEFSTQNLSNKYIHLTNDAIQKNSEDYGKFENANKLSYSDFDRYFQENPHHQDYEMRFTRDFLPQIRAMIRDTFRSVEKKLDPERRAHTFEVFGYDFMIDDNLKMKLIEVNTNPSIEICCPLLARIVPSMLDSVFRIAIDPLFQQPHSRRNGAWSGSEVINDLKMELVYESAPQVQTESRIENIITKEENEEEEE